MSLALAPGKCQSTEMEPITVTDEAVVVTGDSLTLTYRPRRITVSDGTFLMHESRGGTLSSVWATDLGGRFVEVIHLGDGPVGGELVMVVPDVDVVAVGDLYTHLPPPAPRASWPAAIDLAIGLTTPRSRILTSSGTVAREELEAFHQRLLGLLHG